MINQFIFSRMSLDTHLGSGFSTFLGCYLRGLLALLRACLSTLLYKSILLADAKGMT